MQVLWSCRNCSDAYGPAYVDIYALTRQHAALAGDKACDHMHDGLGFLTMHLGLSLAFEQSIQAVDAAVALPYWDYTVDRYDADRGARPLGDSAMWRSDWFGTADPAVNTVATGRWAFVAAEQGAWDAPVHNSYGFLRAPWNNNDRPWVTRSDSLCGYKFEDTPSCAAHFALLNGTDSWFDFAWQLPYAPHGSVHQYVGGTLDCNDTATALLEFLRDEVNENKYPGFASTSSDLMYLLRTDMFLALKNLYRLDRLAFPAFCSPDAPYSDCASTCDYPTNLNQALAHNNTGAVEAFWGEMMAWDTAIAGSLQTISSRYDWLSEALKVKVMTHLCDAGFGTDGDHLEAASPLDPSFWPVHPTIERLYQYKQLSTGFANESWPDENYAATAGCYGHARTDVVPFAFSLLEGRDGAPAAYTNEELLALASPREPNLPYVYADFDWAHCARAGYDFAALAAARTRR
ncbi:symporter [Aureococcus anophagefferens]|nr:symporter [Aureococcus anophagefferens]